jgi:SpoIID/LytB domain protein
MGQYGALGYATKYGWNAAQILDHYYGGTSAMQVATNSVIQVDMRNLVGSATFVYLETGSLITSADAAIGGAGPRKAFAVVWQGGTNFAIYEAMSCAGPWIGRGVINTPQVIIDPSTTSDDPNTMLQLCEPGQRRYVRGEVIATAFSTVLDAYQQQTINRLRLEDYLRSVVPSESPASWGSTYGAAGMEALRAQAVAARSYVMSGDGRWRPADTCSDTFCQVYSGYGTTTGSGIAVREAATTNQAVAGTAGVVRVMNGTSSIARTEFSSSTGGWTAPSFPPVEDLGDDVPANPNHYWSATLSAAQVESAFNTVAGRNLGSFQSFSVTSRNGFGDFGGRAVTVVGVFSNGSQSTTGTRFRDLTGLKSDWYAVGTPAWQPVSLVRTDGTLAAGPAPAAVRGVNNRLDLFVLGTDNGLWWTWTVGAGWGPWVPLGGPPGGAVGEPGVASWSPGRFDVFVAGSDGRLWQRFSTDSGWTWSAWIQPIGPDGALAAGPSVSSRSPGNLDVIVTGTDGLLYQRMYGPPGWNNAWIPLGAPPGVPAVGRPSAASWSSTRLDVFVRGSDNRLWQRFWGGQQWSGWLVPPGSEGGVLGSAPAVASPEAGSLSAFVRGTDGGLYTTWYGGGPTWSTWTRIGTANDQLVGPPGATTQGSVSLEVFLRGTDNRAYRFRYGV